MCMVLSKVIGVGLLFMSLVTDTTPFCDQRHRSTTSNAHSAAASAASFKSAFSWESPLAIPPQKERSATWRTTASGSIASPAVGCQPT